MKLKSFNLNRLLRLILPSIFFIVCIIGYLYGSTPFVTIINLIAAGIALLLLGNIFLQNKIISRILGIIFLLGSCFMLFALYSDVVNGKATLGYLIGLFLVLSGFVMSILLILSYKKKMA